MSQLVGGYYTLRNKALKGGGFNPHTEALNRPAGPLALEGINWVQKTRWSINRKVLDVAQRVREMGIEVAGIPPAYDLPLPPRLPDSVWETMDREDRRKYISELEEIRSKNAGLAGNREQIYRRLDLARELADQPVLWFPHFFDFRGRVYPIPQDLNPQGDSLAKGLLTFAERSPLGPEGFRWLCIAFANSMGQDKIDLDDRERWTMDHLPEILMTADDPEATIDWWGGDDADSPWEAIALADEIAAALRWSREGGSLETFPSHIPVRLDATCSGIQHLSAFMWDPVAARCVNVLPTGRREDIYSDVSKVAAERVSMDAANGVEFAALWLNKVNRKLVKRAVMTTPYGVTPQGIADQLINDGFTNHIDRSLRHKAAAYMRDVIVGSLDANIGAPRAAMEYIQTVARELAERDLPLQWTTPADFTVRQAYYESDMVKAMTIIGRVTYYRENADAGLIKKRQALASAPNVVHSYDSAHLIRTTVRMKHEGVRDLAFVHDSFGCHAGHIPTLNRVLREEFVAMYSEPQLLKWRDSVIKHTGCTALPEPPAMGDLDVTQVMESPFFFS